MPVGFFAITSSGPSRFCWKNFSSPPTLSLNKFYTVEWQRNRILVILQKFSFSWAKAAAKFQLSLCTKSHKMNIDINGEKI